MEARFRPSCPKKTTCLRYLSIALHFAPSQERPSRLCLTRAQHGNSGSREAPTPLPTTGRPLSVSKVLVGTGVFLGVARLSARACCKSSSALELLPVYSWPSNGLFPHMSILAATGSPRSRSIESSFAKKSPCERLTVRRISPSPTQWAESKILFETGTNRLGQSGIIVVNRATNPVDTKHPLVYMSKYVHI